MVLNTALDMVRTEVERATRLYPALNSGHEGYAVIREELDELWDEVKKSKTSVPQSNAACVEALQVAAMAVRFALDLCDVEHAATVEKS